MQRISTFCLVLLILVACHHPNPDPGDRSSTSRLEGPPEGAPEGPPMMEKGTAHVPVHLTPGETAGLSQAVNQTPVANDAQSAHIHADVRDGQLVFVPEPSQDPSHVTPDATRITVGGRNPKTVLVVATPAAKQLLDQRASQPH